MDKFRQVVRESRRAKAAAKHEDTKRNKKMAGRVKTTIKKYDMEDYD